MTLPKSHSELGCSRIAVLVKIGFNVKILEQFMDGEVATIWLQVSGRGLKSVTIGAIYRQFRLLRQGVPNLSGEPDRQLSRWRKIINQWRAASRGKETIIMGDLNLDFRKWEDPDQDSLQMTDLVKSEIQTLGFHQLVRGITRSWPHQEDSTLDHCWTAQKHYKR